MLSDLIKELKIFKLGPFLENISESPFSFMATTYGKSLF